MLKHMLCFLAFVSPCMGATLSGIVRLDEGRPLSGAKVVVLHELAMVLVRQGFTDRKGEYRFNLEPGPYRIFIFKEDALPHATRTMLLHADEELTLEHRLVKTVSVSQKKPSTNLKNILRKSNREPFRDADYGPVVALNWDANLGSLFGGEVRAMQSQDLDGAVMQTAAYDVAAQVNDHLQLQSHMANQTRHQVETTRIQAGLALQTERLALGIAAETIQPDGQDQARSSDQLRLSGSYGQQWLTTTSLALTRSPQYDSEQMALSLTQAVSYNLGAHPIVHQVDMRQWSSDQDAFARETVVSTVLPPIPGRLLGAELDFHQVRLADDHLQHGKVRLTSRLGNPDHVFAESRVGVVSQAGDAQWIQDHRLQWQRTGFQFGAQYRNDVTFESPASQDIFGSFLPEPATPYATEAFFRQKQEESEMTIASQFSRGWYSVLTWRRLEQNVTQLYSVRPDTYKLDARHQREEFRYAVRSERLGSSLELSHSQHEAAEQTFESVGLSFTQRVNPFRNAGVEMLVQLQMRNQPDLPAWWLLERMPWSPNETNTWYEGYLSLQF